MYVCNCGWQSVPVLYSPRENDILYTVALVYGTKNSCDPRVLLSLDQSMDSDSGSSTKLCFFLKSMVRRYIFLRS